MSFRLVGNVASIQHWQAIIVDLNALVNLIILCAKMKIKNAF